MAAGFLASTLPPPGRRKPAVCVTDLGSGAAIGPDSSGGGRRRTLLAAPTLLPWMVGTSFPSAGVVGVYHRILRELVIFG